MVEDLKLERAEQAIARQNLEDDVVDLAGKNAVDDVLSFLATAEGKRRLKEERQAVKVRLFPSGVLLRFVPIPMHGYQRYFDYQKKKRKTWSKAQIEREELRETFELYDTDGSGAIEVAELRLMVDELCIPMSDEELNDVRLSC